MNDQIAVSRLSARAADAVVRGLEERILSGALPDGAHHLAHPAHRLVLARRGEAPAPAVERALRVGRAHVERHRVLARGEPAVLRVRGLAVEHLHTKVPQLVALGAVFAVLAVVMDGTVAIIASRARDWFASSPKRMERVGGAGGLMMLGLGSGLLLTGRPTT